MPTVTREELEQFVVVAKEAASPSVDLATLLGIDVTTFRVGVGHVERVLSHEWPELTVDYDGHAIRFVHPDKGTLAVMIEGVF